MFRFKNKIVHYQSSWFSGRIWLEYSIQNDARYCYYCRHFSSNQLNAMILLPTQILIIERRPLAIFQQTLQMITNAITMSILQVTCERSFSKMKIIMRELSSEFNVS